MSAITTHVLDTSLGRPAVGIGVVLERANTRMAWDRLGASVTDGDGRVRDLMPGGTIAPGVYRLVFDTRGYFIARGARSMFPSVTLTFEVDGEGPSHYHIPLLLSPFGYTTYRGS